MFRPLLQLQCRTLVDAAPRLLHAGDGHGLLDTDTMKPISLQQGTDLCRLMADVSRCRLLSLLESHELSVAELTEITGMAQSRVSTHLSRLKTAGLVSDRRAGNASLYIAALEAEPAASLWAMLRDRFDDPQLRQDLEHAEQVVLARSGDGTWAESVAGRMELHYSPGRSWEATLRAVAGVLQLGDVLDIASGDGVLAELIAEQSSRVDCVDLSPAVVEAARRRLAHLSNVRVHQGDMHLLPFADSRFDHVFAIQALAYSENPPAVLREATRVLKPGGRLIIAALNEHQHLETTRAYDHRNMGQPPEVLSGWLLDAGLEVERCAITSKETRAPYFEVISALARRMI